MCKIHELIILLSFNKVLDGILITRKLWTTWKKTGREQEDLRLEEDLRTRKLDLAGKTESTGVI